MKLQILKMRSGKIYMDKILDNIRWKMLVGNVYIQCVNMYINILIYKIYILD